MARKLSRREGWLLAAAGLTAVFFLWRSWSGAGSAHEAAAAKTTDARRDPAMGKIPVVHMDLLAKAVVTYDPAGLDLFQGSAGQEHAGPW